jgi:prepilin-type N-terminal cleavage/methylation domain-containing protein
MMPAIGFARTAAKASPGSVAVRSKRGLTLIEVMLALGLFAMLSLFVFSVVNSVLGLWQSSERRGSGDLAFAAIIEQWNTDLAALHTGSRGWMVLDQWQARPAEQDQPAWMLPRLRFLALGASLPSDDPAGRSAVEVLWMQVPVDIQNSRLTRLVRASQIEGSGPSFYDDRTADALGRAGAGVAMLDGVAFVEMQMMSPEGENVSTYRVPPDTPFDFPQYLGLSIDRIATSAQRRPIELDQDLSASQSKLVLRGSTPLRVPQYVLIQDEWLQVNGNFPSLSVVEHGSRNTRISDHRRGDAVGVPENYQARIHLAAGGLRVVL